MSRAGNMASALVRVSDDPKPPPAWRSTGARRRRGAHVDERRSLRAGGSESGRLVDLWRRSRQPPLQAVRSDRSRQLQRPRGRVAIQDRRAGAAAGVQLPGHAAGDQRRALHGRRLAPRRRRARRRHGRDALDAPRGRRQARRRSAAAALRTRSRLLDRREGGADRLRDARLSDDRARCEDRPPGSRVRQGRRRRSQARHRSDDRSRDRRNRAACRADHRQGRHHRRRRTPAGRRAEEPEPRKGIYPRRTTRGPASGCGSSTPFRSAASSATRPGSRDPGSTRATSASGRR